MPKGCRLISIPGVRDERGELAFAEVQKEIPFDVRRIFWIYNVPDGAVRGGHAHWECAEVVVPVCGAFTIMLDDGQCRVSLHMTSPHEGVLIPPGVWCELRDFQPGTLLVVMASQTYNPVGYVHSYEQYLKCKGI